MIKNILRLRVLFWIIFGSWHTKIFCISFQRTGTTSTGQFFLDHGFRVARYHVSKRNDWTLKWFQGDWESIFKSSDFKLFQVFEDDPWWCTDFYKVLFHRFPKSKFILLERDSDKWFDSMVSHSSGKNPGNSYRHAIVYRREMDFYKLGTNQAVYSNSIDNLLPITEDYRNHYKMVYELRNKAVKEFFNHFGKHRLFTGQLEDTDLWIKMGLFFEINVERSYQVHVNKSVK